MSSLRRSLIDGLKRTRKNIGTRIKDDKTYITNTYSQTVDYILLFNKIRELFSDPKFHFFMEELNKVDNLDIDSNIVNKGLQLYNLRNLPSSKYIIEQISNLSKLYSNLDQRKLIDAIIKHTIKHDEQSITNFLKFHSIISTKINNIDTLYNKLPVNVFDKLHDNSVRVNLQKLLTNYIQILNNRDFQSIIASKHNVSEPINNQATNNQATNVIDDIKNYPIIDPLIAGKPKQRKTYKKKKNKTRINKKNKNKTRK